MKARLFKIKGNWFVIDPPKDLFYEQDIEDENYAKHFALSIYNLRLIQNVNNWKNNTWVEGEVINNQFKIKDAIYKEEEIRGIQDLPSIEYIKNIIKNNNKVAITIAQYNKIHELASQDNFITCYMTNGYCVNHKYVIFGKLTKKNKIIYPQIKLKTK